MDWRMAMIDASNVTVSLSFMLPLRVAKRDGPPGSGSRSQALRGGPSLVYLHVAACSTQAAHARCPTADEETTKAATVKSVAGEKRLSQTHGHAHGSRQHRYRASATRTSGMDHTSLQSLPATTRTRVDTRVVVGFAHVNISVT